MNDLLKDSPDMNLLTLLQFGYRSTVCALNSSKLHPQIVGMNKPSTHRNDESINSAKCFKSSSFFWYNDAEFLEKIYSVMERYNKEQRVLQCSKNTIPATLTKPNFLFTIGVPVFI